mgnify:CR=1 FL=1
MLTHNKPLSRDLESRFNRMEGHLPKCIEWRTFNAWCFNPWPKTIPWVAPLSMRMRQRYVHEAWQETLEDSSISEHMLLSEIDWLKAEAPGLLGTRAIKWNFTKFLIDRQGRVVRRYAPTDKPEAIEADIAALL